MSQSRNKVWPESPPMTETGQDFQKVRTESPPMTETGQDFQKVRTESERLKALDQIRQLCRPLAVKLKLKEKLMEVPVADSHGLKQLKLINKRRWESVSNRWKNVKYSMEPWGKVLTKVEGQHGTGVVSYFVFLRYLLLVNIAMFLLTMLIWVPQSILASLPYVAGSAEETCSSKYTVNISTNALNLVLDFMQGTGWMEQTPVFYGYYSGNGLVGTNYKLSLAYILVCISCLIVSILLMGRQMASSFRKSVLNSAEGTNEFCNQVFGTWDYTLSEQLSADIKHKSIRYELISNMNELRFLRERNERLQRPAKRCWLYTVRFFINIFIVVCLGAAAYVIYYIIGWSTDYGSSHSDPTSTEAKLVKLLVQFLPSITIVVLNAVLPEIFEKVVLGEQYTQAFVILITLIRTVFLRLASLTVLMVTLYSQITCSPKDACTTTQSSCAIITCWETYVGQNLYKLIITDLLVAIVKTFLVELPRRLLYDKCGCGLMKKIGPPEFNLPANVLDLVYSQCLYWLSLTFAPLTPGIAVLKTFITFYLRLLSALKACSLPEQPYRSSRSNAFFMIVLLVAFFMCSVPVGYTFYSLEPSHGCGPFRTYGYMYYAITSTVQAWPSAAHTVYNLVVSPAVTGPVILLLCLLIYCKSVLNTAHKNMSEKLRVQLVQEEREKHYLAMKVKELGGDGKIPPKPYYRNPPTGLAHLDSVEVISPSQPAPRKPAPAKRMGKPPPYKQLNDSPQSSTGQLAHVDYQDNNRQTSAGISLPPVPDVAVQDW